MDKQDLDVIQHKRLCAKTGGKANVVLKGCELPLSQQV